MPNDMVPSYNPAQMYPGPQAGDHPERLFLDCGRGLVLAGAALVFISTGGNTAAADGASALLGFFLLLFGVCLLMLSASAHKFPTAPPPGAEIDEDGDLVY